VIACISTGRRWIGPEKVFEKTLEGASSAGGKNLKDRGISKSEICMSKGRMIRDFRLAGEERERGKLGSMKERARRGSLSLFRRLTAKDPHEWSRGSVRGGWSHEMLVGRGRKVQIAASGAVGSVKTPMCSG